MNNLTILPSPINGLGVFTNKEFKRGDLIINWEPCLVKLTKEQINSLSPAERKFVQNNTLLRSPSRFLNHSCSPNTIIIEGKNIAQRDILKKEEITIDYSKEDIPQLGMICNCKNKNCRRIIEAHLTLKTN
ncbi:SET domain-containing protein-lysine N-methyltransferase [Candidatus Woesearchaeota archaeon]|nr:SET domain-containing protein-lysine N-methyltransferase [Candidatus Woesearchaeota archaeon]